ncbi:hypothetical protein HK105_205356 [Polyrhizophydium stewartii]|uniref:Uncharacterized protein n=1 Tax=Polyrhizophydium stewartii TaxID=2732419 RepID=A0ABR4N6E1_9FUNG|nr:hypothetical protein HK105_008344 [Polyrhizophydium stewartii]
MPVQQTPDYILYEFVQLNLHFRWALTVYMFVKGIRWAIRNNLSLILLIVLAFAVIEASFQATYLVTIVGDCVAHLRLLYSAWIIYTFLLDCVLYYRAWCISASKTQLQLAVSIFLTVGHMICLIIDALYSISVTKDLGIGCESYPGWPRSLYGAWSTINDIVQVGLFCGPLLGAVKNVANMRHDSTTYRRMIMKSVVCLTICTIANVTYSIVVSMQMQVLSLIFSDISLLFQILSACEIQFNSHRETDKASLGALIQQAPPQGPRKLGDTNLPFSNPAADGKEPTVVSVTGGGGQTRMAHFESL